MDSPFAIGIIRVDLGDGLWADIKEYLNHADVRAIRRAMLRGMVTADTITEATISLKLREDWDIGADEIEMVCRCVRAWNFPDKDGIAPIKEETLLGLKETIWQQLVAALNKQYAPMSDGKKKLESDVS